MVQCTKSSQCKNCTICQPNNGAVNLYCFLFLCTIAEDINALTYRTCNIASLSRSFWSEQVSVPETFIWIVSAKHEQKLFRERGYGHPLLGPQWLQTSWARLLEFAPE